MKAMRIYLFLALLGCSLTVSAQRRLVVVDVETLVPVDGANVVCNGLATQSDSLGYVTVSDTCQSIVFSHVNYESRIINLTEIRDTVFLISKLLNVKEVVVFGIAPYKDKDTSLQNKFRLSKSEAQLLAATPTNGINLFGLISYLIPDKWKKSKKERRRERLQRILDNY